ncbi:MAG: NHL repeat-containing protein [Candidatus Rifleibacteriota bacterium]
MKKLCLLLLMALLSSCLYGENLFQYRGAFPADRERNTEITNYILLKENKTVKFKLEQQGGGTTQKVRISEIKLTSDPEVIATSSASINLFEVENTGIYQIKIQPWQNAGGEIRFILKVSEATDEEIARQDKNSAKPENAPTDSEIKSSPDTSAETNLDAEPVSKKIESDRVVKDTSAFSIDDVEIGQIQTVEDIRKAKEEEEEEEEEEEIASKEEASKKNGAAVDQNKFFTESSNSVAKVSADKDLTTNTDEKSEKPVKIMAPLEGYYLNPFNGIKFRVDNAATDSLELVKNNTQIYLTLVDSSKRNVKGNFFAESDNIVCFLPAKLIPGAVYTVNCQLTQPSVNRFAAFPNLACESVSEEGKTKIRLYWKQLEQLLPNPDGQVIKLENTRVQIFSDQETFLTLDLGKVAPYGVVNNISYSAGPYELNLIVHDNSGLTSQPSYIKVETLVEGEKNRAEVFRSKIGAETGSDDEATNTVQLSSEKNEISENKISMLASLPEDCVFKLVQSFSVAENPAELRRAWPEDVFWSEDGTLWVVDSQRRKILNFTEEGRLRLSFGEKGKTDGRFSLPVAITANTNRLFVADKLNHSLMKFSHDGSFLEKISNTGGNQTLINLPVGMCFRANELWVADRGLSRINCFDIDGNYLGGFGGPKSKLVKSPVSVRVDSEGLVILEKSGILKKFTPMGQQTVGFHTGCSEVRGFDVDPWDSIWVCDSASYQVVRLSPDGKTLTRLGSPPGPQPWVPTGVSVRKDGLIAVSDAESAQIHIFSPE